MESMTIIRSDRAQLWLYVVCALAAPLQASAQEETTHSAEGRGAVTVEHAEIVLSPSPSGMAAGYLTVSNNTEQQVALTSVATPSFGQVSLHRSEMKEGIARMRPVLGPLRIPQNTELVMRPGGIHLMLMQPAPDTKPGARVALEVAFADGSTKTVSATVLGFGEKPTDHHHGEKDDVPR
ncbi:copper chaperone PCu(A)C [Pararhizobium haloflavum]|uniref:copper chaperone PCu(A)C n=1 Tax=Pararhizobium haloflavum TaxID=2037914 RepID=UPI0012FFFE4E|nr:copper chaperone PCu(A)C [Pararhizobium haloflavum]